MLDLFERLLAEGEAGILRLINERVQETVSLEFKTKESRSHGDFDKPDKRQFGEALSALSNSQGGLLVWGVVARRDEKEGVDCAVDRKPIANIALFRSRATELAGRLLAPKHDGIRIEAIESSDQSGSGYLLVFVERSDRRPHRSLAPDDHRYYRRAGDSTFVMEHGDLEDSFNRRDVARIDLTHRTLPAYTNSGDGHRERLGFSLQLGLRNGSRVSARHAYLYLRVAAPPFNLRGGLGFMPIEWDHRALGDGWHRITSGGDRLIHPSELIWVGSLTIEVERRFGLREDFVFDRPVNQIKFVVPYRLGSLDAPMVEGEYVADGIASLLPPWP